MRRTALVSEKRGVHVIFALIQYFRDIPYELDEAAFLDGASYFRILTSIIVPLAIRRYVYGAVTGARDWRKTTHEGAGF